jgi:hypothetical protein
LVPAAEAAPNDNANDNAKARDAHRKKHRDAIGRHEEWSVQLIVETADGQLSDPANVLGQLTDADADYDDHDLIELDPETPLPEDGPQLTVVFPHSDWNNEAGDYNSDYHDLSKNKADAWDLEVRGNQTGLLRLRWSISSPEAQERGRLVDLESGAVIAAAEADHYEFQLNGPSRAFRWEYLSKNGKPPK